MAQGDPDLFTFVTTGLLGVAGRFVFFTQERRNPFSLEGMFEIPGAVLGGWIGAAIAAQVPLIGFPQVICIVLAGLYAPKIIYYYGGKLFPNVVPPVKPPE